MTSLIAPRRDTRTYVLDGRERYADTGRPIDQRLGSHVVLWIVDDPEAWAKFVETEGDAEAKAWGKRKAYIGEPRRQRAYESAARIRAEGCRRDWYTICHSLEEAEQCVTSLYRGQPNPGVRYEAVPILAVDACQTCHTPTVDADGVRRHHTGGYNADCRIEPEPEPETPLEDGEFEINVGHGTMTCGYCAETATWAESALGYATLTGFHLLGIHRETNTLVVLAEATTLTGATTHLPHHCLHIPEDKHREYAPDTILARDREST